MEKLMWVILAPAILIMVWALCSLPVMLELERQCLAAGYPKYSLTWNWEKYCLTLDGNTTVRVDRQR